MFENLLMMENVGVYFLLFLAVFLLIVVIGIAWIAWLIKRRDEKELERRENL